MSTLPSAEDDDALARAFAARAGDALACTYERYGARLRAIARSVVDAASADDIVHETLVRVWESAAYRIERGPLGPYLGACVRNAALNDVRAQSRRAARELRVVADIPTDADLAERLAVQTALDRLPADQRAAIDRVYFRAMTQVEAAADLRVPLGTVKGRIAAAIRRLAAELADA